MLQGELWTRRLATEVGIEWDTCLALWTIFVEQIELRLSEGQALDLAKLGQWSSTILPESIADTEEGAYLIPPRVVLRIEQTRADALPIRDLALSLEHRTGVCSDTISKWLECIPSLASTLLEAGHSVVWEHLGIWTPLEQAYSFAPSVEFADALNRPFASFRVEPLRADTPTVDLERREMTLEQIANVEPLLLPVGVSTTRDDEDLSEVLPLEVSTSTTTTAPPVVSQSNEADLAAEEVSAIEDESPRTSRGRGWCYFIFFFCLLLLFLGLCYRYCPHGQSKTNAVQPVPRDTIQPNEVTSPKDTILRIVEEVDTTVVTPDTVVIPRVTDKKKAEPQHNVEQQSKIQGVGTKAEPRVQPKSTAPAPVVSRESTASKPDKIQTKPSPNAEVREEVSLREDESLAVLAQRKYGHRAFWVYIYEENREYIVNPHNIPIGTRLVLPPASKYGIDKNNTKSLNQALLLGRSL